MTHRHRGACVWLLLVLSGTASASGTSPGQHSAPTAPAAGAAETAVPPVRLNVLVTDPRGRQVLNLQPADFEIRDNGVTQKLATAELRDTRVSSPRASPDDGSREEESRLAAEPGTRVFAFVLDEFHVAPGEASDRVRAALGQFIDRLRPGDLALAVRPLDSLTSLRVTRDRAPLRATVAAFEGRKGDDRARTDFERQFIGSAPEAVHAARAQIITSALREVAIRLDELRPERAAIVYVSDGFTRPAPGTGSRMPDIQGVVRACSRFNIPIYSFSPAPPATPDTDAARAAAMLKGLSVQTGGEMVSGSDALADGLRRMDDDLTVYYALTFQPVTPDGRFHAIEVRTRRPNLLVRTRSGYFAPLPPSLRTTTANLPPLSRRELKHSMVITAWTGVSRAADGKLWLTLTWEPRPPTKAAALLVTARTPSGTPLYESKIGRVGDKAVGTSGDSARFEVQPGRVELDLAVLGMSGSVLDIDKRDIDVPDLATRKGPFLFTPEVVRARTLPEFRVLNADSLAAPTPARTFTRADRLLIRVSAWDPTGASVDLTAQVLNVAGRPMRPIDKAPAGTLFPAEFDLPLAWLAPGEYAVEVKAHSENGDAREVVRFTLR